MGCTACAASLPQSARFCPACGTPTATGPVGSGGEHRKVVSVLFCDLVGSTALSTRLEPEMLRMITMNYFTLMQDRISAHGGTVEKFIGDAVMAVFGVPVVHEDDAHRAASAALDMMVALAGLNDDLERSVGERLSVRVGINTGEAIATIEPGARQALVSGEVVNMAARLEQRAGANEILIGPDTCAALGALATVDDVGEIELRGKAEPVHAWRLRALRAGGPEANRRFDVRFVGRAAELGALRSVWDDVAGARNGRVVAVVGDAGIGKTRLLREWLGGIPGTEVLRGTARCHPYRDRASLAPLATALRELLTEHERAGAASAALPALDVLREGLLHDGTPGPSYDVTCAALGAVLADVAAARPVALVLDDLHWADELLVETLHRVVEQVPDSPVLVVGVARCADGEEYRAWPERPAAAMIRLGPLPPAESSELGAALLVGGPEVQGHGPGTLTSVVERAEGNPLYLEQLVAMVAEQAVPGRLPATVSAVLGARIDALRADERRALDAAAVIGRTFAVEELDVLVGEHHRPALDVLRRQGFVEHRAGGMRFRSGLLHEVALGAVAKLRRAGWHEMIAKRPRTGPFGTAERGHHWEQAYRCRLALGVRDTHTEDLRGRAARAMCAAGDAALARSDLSWSERMYRRALGCSGTGDAWLATVLSGLGEALVLGGRAAEGIPLLEQAEAAATGSADELGTAHARLQLAVLTPGASADAAAAVAAQVLPTFRNAGDHRGTARALNRIAQDRQAHGRHGDAVALLADALAAGESTGGAGPELAVTLGALGVSLWHGPTPAAMGIARAEELLARYGPGRTLVAITVSCPLAVVLAMQERFGEARAKLAAAAELAGSLGLAEARAVLPLFDAEVDQLAGDLPAATSRLREALRSGAGASRFVAGVTRALARVLLDRGQPLDPIDDLDRTAADAVPGGEYADLAGLRARLCVLDGDHTTAQGWARTAIVEAARTDSPLAVATAHVDAAIVWRATGRSDLAADALRTAAAMHTAKGNLAGLRVLADISSRIEVRP